MFGWNKVKINYKSGNSLIIIAQQITVKKSTGRLTEISWENLLSPKKILFLGIDNIESIVQL